MNKIIKNKKFKLWALFLLIFIMLPVFVKASDINISDEDLVLPQSLDSIYFNNTSVASIILKFKNTIDTDYDNSPKNIDNYFFENGYGEILNGSSIGCNNINANGQLTGFGGISNTSVDYVLGVDNLNSVTINTFCKFPVGDYKLCVKNIKSVIYDGKIKNDPMPLTCIDFNTEDKIIAAYPHISNNNIDIYHNFFVYNFNDGNKNYNSYGNYTFKDDYGNVLNGQNVSCYGNPTNHPKIDSSGHPTGPINANLSIDLGCILPIDKNYQLCVSNINDNIGGHVQGEQCVPFSETPILLNAEHVQGSRNKIKLVFDNAISTLGSYITVKDSSGNILTNSNFLSLNSYGNPANGFSNDYKKIYIDLAGNVSYSNPSLYYNTILSPGIYKICMTGVKYGGSTITAPEQCKDVVIKDYTRPFLNNVSTGFAYKENYLSSRKKIVIKYSEPMGGDNYSYGALDKNNYMIKDYDTNGDDIVDVKSWTRLSDPSLVNNISISFSNNSKDVNIEFLSDNLGFIDKETDVMIGDQTNPNSHLIKDNNGNIFVDGKNVNNNYLIGENIKVIKKIDLSSINDVRSVKIISPTEIAFKFGRNISYIDPNEFIIKNTANRNGITPIKADIDSTNNNIVTFTIPDGSSNEFTTSDYGQNKKNVELSTKDTINSSKDVNDLLFSASSTFGGYMDVIFINNLLNPEIKSVRNTSSDWITSNTVLLEISGDVTGLSDLSNLGDSIIISQNINGNPIDIAYGSVSYYSYDNNGNAYIPNNKIYSYYLENDSNADMFNVISSSYNEFTNSTFIYGDFGTRNLRNNSFTVKTKPNGDITFSNLANKKLLENTSGIASFDDFYPNNFVSNFVYDSGHNLDKGSCFFLIFNKNIDKNTIISNNKWKRFNESKYESDLVNKANDDIGCGKFSSDICYIQKIPRGIMFDEISKKILFPGTNIGQIYYDGDMSVGGQSYATFADLYVIFNQNNNNMMLYINDNVDVNVSNGDRLYYVPSDKLKTKSGKSINTNFGMNNWFEISEKK